MDLKKKTRQETKKEKGLMKTNFVKEPKESKKERQEGRKKEHNKRKTEKEKLKKGEAKKC